MLDRFKGNPLLILFVPNPSSEAYIEQWNRLYRQDDLRVMSIFETEVGDIDGEPIEEDESAALRRLFKIKPGYTVGVFIDANGKEQHRLPLPFDL
ncbi:MAG: hypothetical protein Kow00117_01070 [Phototrophicales bacterium]